MTLALFICTPLGARLTRDACARRHVAFLRTGRHRDDVQRVYSSACAGCAVGAAHARGERPAAWPDGAPLEVVQVTIGGAPRSEEPSRPRPGPVSPPTSPAAAGAAPRAAVPTEAVPRSCAAAEDRPLGAEREPGLAPIPVGPPPERTSAEGRDTRPCAGCGVPVPRATALRCEPCRVKHLETPDPVSPARYCADCGVRVCRRSTVCVACWTRRAVRPPAPERALRGRTRDRLRAMGVLR